MSLYWGWIICGCFLIAYTLCQGIVFSYSEMVVPLQDEMKVGLSVLNWLGAIPSCMPMLLAPIATILNFKLGTRKTVYVGVIIVTSALLMTAFVRNIVLMFLVYGVGGGFGVTLIANPPFYLVGEYFPYDHPRHVLATSIIALSFPLATLGFNPLTYILIESVGWRKTYFIYGCTMLILGSLTAATYKPPCSKSEEETCQESYEDIGSSNTTLHIRTKYFMFVVWFVASISKSIGYYTPLFILVNQMVTHGIGQSKASAVMALLGAVELVSRFVASYLGDYFKGRILYAYVAFSFSLFMVNIIGAFASSFAHWVIYVIALGLFGGPIIAAMYSSCSEILCGQEVPVIFTLFRVGLGVGLITGPTISGVLTDATDSFVGTYIMMATMYLLACICYLIIILVNRYRPSSLNSVNQDETLSGKENLKDLSKYTKLQDSYQ